MVVVIDNSVLVPLFLEDENPSLAEEIFHLGDVALHAPELLLSEFGNVMLVCLRSGRLSEKDVREAHQALTAMGLVFAETPGLPQRQKTHDLAVKHKLSYYDASYLTLALEKNAKLATLDKRLRKAAEAEGAAYQ